MERGLSENSPISSLSTVDFPSLVLKANCSRDIRSRARWSRITAEKRFLSSILGSQYSRRPTSNFTLLGRLRPHLVTGTQVRPVLDDRARPIRLLGSSRN